MLYKRNNEVRKIDNFNAIFISAEFKNMEQLVDEGDIFISSVKI
jgi:hypothetical protein